MASVALVRVALDRLPVFVVAILAVWVVWRRRAYQNANIMWLVKRCLGRVLSQFIPIRVPTVIQGNGSISKIGAILDDLGCSRPLIVTDKMLVKHGLVDKCTDALRDGSIHYEVFSDVVPDPPVELVERAHATYAKTCCDCIIALGGGSPMDVAKVVAAKVAHPKPDITSYEGNLNVGFFRPDKRLPPVIAVPTTAGTGSEATIAAVISLVTPLVSRKVIISDPVLVPLVGVFDPDLLVKLPKPVTASTGMDALTHAIESYIGGWANSFTRPYSLEAVGQIFNYLRRSYEDGTDVVARKMMLNASFAAGVAFTRSNVGYAHAVAHQLGAICHTPHGEANAMLLPHVLRWYLEQDQRTGLNHVTDKFIQLSSGGELVGRHKPVVRQENKMTIAREFVDAIADLNANMNIPSTVPTLTANDVRVVATRALEEAHGTRPCSGNLFSAFYAYMLDLGMPVPHYMTLTDCESIVAKLLSDDELEKFHGLVPNVPANGPAGVDAM